MPDVEAVVRTTTAAAAAGRPCVAGRRPRSSCVPSWLFAKQLVEENGAANESLIFIVHIRDFNYFRPRFLASLLSLSLCLEARQETRARAASEGMLMMMFYRIIISCRRKRSLTAFFLMLSREFNEGRSLPLLLMKAGSHQRS